ncbi:MAG: hypothetical protein Ct9H300mP1_38450 [Planctomycetaceae bacterium]|nr:MAG: hypothetical protein Ct9H300mP1_38450 [Planctomycetaceae bacterium]
MKEDLSSHYVNWYHNCLIPHPGPRESGLQQSGFVPETGNAFSRRPHGLL